MKTGIEQAESKPVITELPLPIENSAQVMNIGATAVEPCTEVISKAGQWLREHRTYMPL